MDPAEYMGSAGGPNTGDHLPPDWFIQYGMDLKGKPGAKVYAAFDGTVSVYKPHTPADDTSKIFGAQIFIRYPYPTGQMGGFYTHITGVPSAIAVGKDVSRGDFLGKIIDRGPASHLHHAVMEYVSGAKVGVDLYSFYLALQTTYSAYALPVRFKQDGNPPEVLWPIRHDEQAANKVKEPAQRYQP
ncbi:peptidoglycan DD-metalloendopeptidase family protein [Nocardia gamkensis]|uniref:M23 family metallopeptidase n=1 Tax=Nocardia gamkensis TaxID=352869 RepID=A0A7X6L0Z9_9NOCA|nr:peptidoglycan DD-metalloendopeptidase family protein [Nocardia gamkensis]NKY25874.1 M23 family metallopeptidase [Nocardia gamkensis]